MSIQTSDYLLPLAEALLFVGSVYLQKWVRRSLKLWGKQHKQLSRITFVTLLTIILMFFNYSEKCAPFGIRWIDCFYFRFDLSQCLQVIFANSILFAYHIYCIYLNKQKFKSSLQENPIRKLVFAPLLEEILFRAIFYRSANQHVPIWYLSAIFAISHIHRSIRRYLAKKHDQLNQAIFQIIFTFVFGIYTFHFLVSYESIIPSILLHMYCNLLGPPSFSRKNSFVYHLLCIAAFFGFIIIYT